MKGLTDMNTAYIKLDRDAALALRVDVVKILRHLLDENIAYERLENEYYNLPIWQRLIVSKPKKPSFINTEIKRFEDIYNILNLDKEMYFSVEDYLYVKELIDNA